MIVYFENKLCVLVEKLNNYGPEPHYRAIRENKELIIAIQPSGKVVGVFEHDKETDFHAFAYYFSSEYMKSWNASYLHRECGPAFSQTSDDLYNQYRIDGKLHRLDGPAITKIISGSTIRKEYYIEDREYKFIDFEQEVKKYKKRHKIK